MTINQHRTQYESVLASVSVQYEHFYTIVYKPFLSVSVSVSVSDSVNTIIDRNTGVQLCVYSTGYTGKRSRTSVVRNFLYLVNTDAVTTIIRLFNDVGAGNHCTIQRFVILAWNLL